MFKKLCAAVAFNCLLIAVSAQKPYKTEISANLISEGQCNLSNNKTNWINLLEIGIETSVEKNVTLVTNLISIQNTRIQKCRKEEGVCNDRQMFSNIEEDNQELSLFAFGPEWRVTDRLTTFAGVRNVNLDYFTSPLTSLFTGSSQGIYPTLSENWELLSNYPLSAICLHAEWNFSGNWEIKNSFYNGVASANLTGSFRFRPGRDGVFNITQLGYVEPEDSCRPLGQYYLGIAYGNAPNKEGGNKHSRTSYYGLIEQPLVGRIGLLLEGSWVSTSQPCHAYYAAGLVFSDLLKKGAVFGVMANRALFEEGQETDVEITYSLPIGKHITVQPSMHFIRTCSSSNTVGLLRISVNL